MPRDIKFTGYADDPQDIVDAVANIEGSTEECLAWYADGLFVGGARLALSETEVGQLRYNRACGELPAVFTVTAGDGTKYVRVRVSQETTVTPAGGTSIRIGSSGDFVTTPLTLTANTSKDIYFRGAGSFTIPQRILVTYLYIASLGSSVITGDITGMNLTYLSIFLSGSSVITGDITGMELTTLYLYDIGASVINGNITGMELTFIRFRGLGSSLISYGTNQLNITNNLGIQLLGDTVFATSQEYERLIQDAAIATWGGAYQFRIDSGTNDNCPDWDTVKANVAVLLTKAAWTIIPTAWLSANGGTWPADWQAIGLAMAQYEDDVNYPTDVNVAAAIGDTGLLEIFGYIFEGDLKTKNLTFSGYTGDTSAIIAEDSPSLAEGSTDIQKLAYYIDAYYNEFAGGEIILSNTVVGNARIPYMALVYEIPDPSTNIELAIQANSTWFSAGQAVVISWGDGSANEAVSATSGQSGYIGHTYAAAGTYTVKISGSMKIYWRSSTVDILGQTLLTRVDSFGNLGITSFILAFYHCDGLISVPKTLPSKVRNMPYMFYGCTDDAFNPDVSNWDVSNVTDMAGMFYGCRGAGFNPDVSNWDVSNVTDMSYIFLYCRGAGFNPNMKSWTLKAGVTTGAMFTGSKTQPATWLDELLVAWAANPKQGNNITINFSPNKFSTDGGEPLPAVATALQTLIGKGWSITTANPYPAT